MLLGEQDRGRGRVGVVVDMSVGGREGAGRG